MQSIIAAHPSTGTSCEAKEVILRCTGKHTLEAKDAMDSPYTADRGLTPLTDRPYSKTSIKRAK